ncbi:unnamed protein product [Victoria cruziana]
MELPRVEQLREFITNCSLGAKVPWDTSKSGLEQHSDRSSIDARNDDMVESDIELESDLVELDNDLPQKMGDPSIEVTQERLDAAQIAKARGMVAITEDRFIEAIDDLTEAILLNPGSAILFATRAGAFVKLRKPNAAIRDAVAALQINPDLAKGYKYRGMARAMIGEWQEAARDLNLASNLDHDEEISATLKKVIPNARKIEEHKRKYERLVKEREQKKAEQDAARKEAVAELKHGSVTIIQSVDELASKFSAAKVLSRLMILYFSAAWCGPCRMISPVYSELAKEYLRVVFLKVDIDQLREAAAEYNINSVPTFFFLRNGEVLDKVVGADRRELERKLVLHAGTA